MENKSSPQRPKALTPQALLAALQNVSTSETSTPYQAFRGIDNLDYHNNKAKYCYAISFLQLLFHSQIVTNYLFTEEFENKNDIILQNLLNSLYVENNEKSVKFDYFVRKFRGWRGRYRIPNDQCDILEFGQFLLDSLSKEFSDLFLHDIINEEEYLYQTDEDTFRKYFVQLPISNSTIQNILNDKISTIQQIHKLPQCLFISLLRQDTDRFNKQCVSVNSFIHISDITYKFVGVVMLHIEKNSKKVSLNKKQLQKAQKTFQKKDSHKKRGNSISKFIGHFTCIIKIDDHHFLFDDDKVSPLFHYKGCPNDTLSKIRYANEAFNEESVLFLYEMYEGEDVSDSLEQIQIEFKSQETLQDKFEKSIMESESENSPVPKEAVEKPSDLYFHDDDQLSYLQTSKLIFSDHSSSDSECENIFYEKRKYIQSPPSLSEKSLLSTSQLTEKKSFSEPRVPLKNAHSWSFDPGFLQGDFSKIGHFPHGGLTRSRIDVDNLKSTVLHGQLTINLQGIPSIQRQRENDCRFNKYRNLFKMTARILRQLDYNDQGLINANITKNKLGIQSKDNEFVKEQGNLLYEILKGIFDESNYDFSYVDEMLKPIVENYKKIYGDSSDQEVCNDQVIDDNIKESDSLGLEIPRSKPLSKNELDDLIKSINSKDILDFFEEEDNEFFDDKYFRFEVSPSKSIAINYLYHEDEEAIINSVELLTDDADDEEDLNVNVFLSIKDEIELFHIASFSSIDPYPKNIFYAYLKDQQPSIIVEGNGKVLISGYYSTNSEYEITENEEEEEEYIIEEYEEEDINEEYEEEEEEDITEEYEEEEEEDTNEKYNEEENKNDKEEKIKEDEKNEKRIDEEIEDSENENGTIECPFGHYKRYLQNENEPTEEIIPQTNLEFNISDENESEEKDNDSSNSNKGKGLGYYLLGSIDWLKNPEMYEQFDVDKTIDNYYWENDDNQFVLGNYDWRERIILSDAKIILSKIQNSVYESEKKLENRNKKDGILALKKLFYRDFIRLYLSASVPKGFRKRFCLEFIEDMKADDKRWSIIDDIRHKSEMKMKKIREKKSRDDDICSVGNLLRMIRNYEKFGEEKKKEFVEDGPDFTKGGQREAIQKVTNDTLLCIIVLVLDFPTLSAESIAKYLNSRYGPNYQYEKNVSARTVQRYLKCLKFSIKKASFAPPNRNNIGLRIFRVAWSKIMEDILKNENVLIAFVDEAAVTTNEGRRFGRAFAGITPVLNTPLSKTQMTIVAIVIPCYGVLYKFIDGACNGKDYAQFLREAMYFIRKYICNKDTDVVIIEDNCPMHSTEDVDDVIEEMKIALLPIVPYSPCLNECVEGYFGLTKTKNIMTSGELGEVSLKGEIKNNWIKTTNKHFKEKKSISSFKEWKSRLEMCKEGLPIYSGHTNTYHFTTKEIEKNLEVFVDRLFDQNNE